jgi:outer membrane protein OmpA-like peptidoglycan-associated protein
MKSQIIRKRAGLNLAKNNTVLQYFEVQPDGQNLPKYICDLSYLVKQIDGKIESFYVNRGGEEIPVFVNHKPDDGDEFVQTKKDETSKDNLWSLPDFEFSKDDYVRKGIPEAKKEIEYIEKPYTLKNLIPYLLSALALGLLLPILFCWLTGGCFIKPCPECPPIVIPNCDSCKQSPCPIYNIVVLDTVIHFKYDKTEYDNLEGENYEKTLEECLNLYKKDKNNFYVELRGFADYKGGLDYNEELAAQRVIKIANYFIKNGVSKNQFVYQNEFGNTYARKTKDSKIQAQDRKVEIRIYGLGK